MLDFSICFGTANPSPSGIHNVRWGQDTSFLKVVIMQLPIWVWKCTPMARRIVRNLSRPHHIASRGIGRFIRAGRMHLPTHAILATAMTCAFVPLATAIGPPALPTFIPVDAAPILFAPEGLSGGASDIGSWKTGVVSTQVAQPASSLFGLAGKGNALAFDVPSSTNIGLLAIGYIGPSPLSAATTFIPVTTLMPDMATPIPEMAIPTRGVLPSVSTEIDEPGSSVLFALSIVWIAASRLWKPLQSKNTGRPGNSAQGLMVVA